LRLLLHRILDEALKIVGFEIFLSLSSFLVSSILLGDGREVLRHLLGSVARVLLVVWRIKSFRRQGPTASQQDRTRVRKNHSTSLKPYPE
jgi:hypothetical protein